MHVKQDDVAALSVIFTLQNTLLLTVWADRRMFRVYLDVPAELRAQVDEQLASRSPVLRSSSTLPLVLLTAALTKNM